VFVLPIFTILSQSILVFRNDPFLNVAMNVKKYIHIDIIKLISLWYCELILSSKIIRWGKVFILIYKNTRNVAKKMVLTLSNMTCHCIHCKIKYSSLHTGKNHGKIPVICCIIPQICPFWKKIELFGNNTTFPRNFPIIFSSATYTKTLQPNLFVYLILTEFHDFTNFSFHHSWSVILLFIYHYV